MNAVATVGIGKLQLDGKDCCRIHATAHVEIKLDDAARIDRHAGRVEQLQTTAVEVQGLAHTTVCFYRAVGTRSKAGVQAIAENPRVETSIARTERATHKDVIKSLNNLLDSEAQT